MTAKRASPTLDRMSPNEQAGVLRALLASHPELRAEAEQIAVDTMAVSSVEAVAQEAHDAVASVDNEALRGRAGKHSWGYVEPGEAAWELLGEAVRDTLDDMKRRAKLGLHEAAETICCGFVLGLYRAQSPNTDGPLGYAPDFLTEEAGNAVTELIRARSPGDRASTRDRLVEALGELVPDWDAMLARVADQAVRKR